MSKNIAKLKKMELFGRRAEEHEIPKGKLGLIFCKKCNVVYYKKSWHHNLRNYKNLGENLKINFSLCPACQMVKNKQFEGEIAVQKAPEKIIDDLIRLVEKSGRRAYKKDPMDRVISVKKTKNGVRITLTENQLAVKIAKKIKEAFKKASVKISYSPEPSDVVYVKIEFPSP